MTYTTTGSVRTAAADGALDARTDAELTSAIDDAARLVDGFCGTTFGVFEGTLCLRSDELARIFLPTEPADLDPASITSVAPRERPTTPLPASAWEWLPAVRGEESVIVLAYGTLQGSSMLVTGAEPWAGGYANLYGRNRGASSEYLVTGSFGGSEIPTAVQTATAMLAAWMLGAPLAGEAGVSTGVDSLAGVKSFSEEGSSVTFETAAPPVRGVEIPTTGLSAADRLLAPHKRAQRGYRIG